MVKNLLKVSLIGLLISFAPLAFGQASTVPQLQSQLQSLLQQLQQLQAGLPPGGAQAVGTAVITAVLNLQEGPGMFMKNADG